MRGSVYLYGMVMSTWNIRLSALGAGVACTKFPIPLFPPVREEVEALIASKF